MHKAVEIITLHYFIHVRSNDCTYTTSPTTSGPNAMQQRYISHDKVPYCGRPPLCSPWYMGINSFTTMQPGTSTIKILDILDINGRMPHMLDKAFIRAKLILSFVRRKIDPVSLLCILTLCSSTRQDLTVRGGMIAFSYIRPLTPHFKINQNPPNLLFSINIQLITMRIH